jgi:bacteriocin biosynthesis cyclodehydratase domain-containing protein
MTSLRRKSLPVRPRLKRTVEPVETPEGDIILMRSIADDIRIVEPDRSERSLLQALDGRSTLDQLFARFGPVEVTESLDQMQTLFLLEDAAEDKEFPLAERARFDRQLRYFSDLREDGPAPAECQQRLREAVVTVLGVGGLGGRVAWELACCGVGELRLFDGDTVEVSNLDRQIQFDESDLGKAKVEVTAERLRRFNSEVRVNATRCRIESEEQLTECIAGADLVIDAVDWPPFEVEAWCNAACFAAGIPYIAMSQLPPLVRVGPLYVPGETGCYACQEIRYRREYPLYDVAIGQLRGRESPAPSLGPPCGVIGGLVGMEAVHFLTGLAPPATLGVGCTIDLRTMEVEREQVVPEPTCPICTGLGGGSVDGGIAGGIAG